jgi:hypothetical protein
VSGPAPPTRLAEQQAALAALEELEARRAQLHAEGLALRAEITRLWEHEHAGSVEMEVAGTALIGQIRAAVELSDGARSVANFPQLQALLADGLVFVPAAEAVLLATRRCTPQVQAGVDARLAPRLVGTNVTDVRRMVSHTILAVEAELDPELTRQRLEQTKADARTWVSPGSDGMTSIGAVLDAVAGRRWALDFEQLVTGQVTLDKREGRDRPLQQVKAEVFAQLPSLVLELLRAARDGRLAELAELANLDPEAAAELEKLAADTKDLPLPEEPDARTEAQPPPEIRVEEDPFDPETVGPDPWCELRWEPVEPPGGPEPPEPGPPPDGDAPWSPADGPDPGLAVLLARCLRMPLPNPVTVNLHLPMATALDLTDAPGHLEGHGPLHGRRIRQLLPDARLREVYVDRDTGLPLGAQPKAHLRRPGQAEVADLARRLKPVVLIDEAEPQHDPSTLLAEFVKLRDQRCDGPGCTMPATRCDLDHETRYPDGPTAEWNLRGRSRRCHNAKHGDWQALRDPDGHTDWTSPTGRTYTSQPFWQPPPRFRKPSYQLYLPREGLEIETEHGGGAVS